MAFNHFEAVAGEFIDVNCNIFLKLSLVKRKCVVHQASDTLVFLNIVNY